jgi:hypothetical protein
MQVRRRPEDVRAGRWEPLSEAGEPLTAVPTDEDKRPDLASIYALTKYAQERAVMIFGEAYETEAVALRLFNVFGAGQALSNPYTGRARQLRGAARQGRAARPSSRTARSGATSCMWRTWRAPSAWPGRRPGRRGGVQRRLRPGLHDRRGGGASGRRDGAPRPRARDPRQGAGGRHPQLLRRHRQGAPTCWASRPRTGSRPRSAPSSTGSGSETVEDRNAEMRRHLEARRLVS